ncbi:MAG: hypothetical protein Q7T16_05310 [Candidatus Burarchaeum sp.]|nr:hypothetical protein [Candidatus Burarchaeum sp.]MDO8340048.1 hypothetical protein [Candidatus Burarchaeum sp.]
MGASGWAGKILSWLAHAFVSLLISLVTLAGTLIAAYSNFRTGMIIFWFGCLLTLVHQAYRMRRMPEGVEKRERIYAGSLFSIAMNLIFGYGGALLIYDVGIKTQSSSSLMSVIFAGNAPFVFALTTAAFATVQIFIAVVRAALAYIYRPRAALTYSFKSPQSAHVVSEVERLKPVPAVQRQRKKTGQSKVGR